ncbi:hypothetical protein QCE62_05570 [Caballeronia sp. LZ033]|uniref:hypothetical protein n=1 Tax=Caballeronia sp. LZ033 TaxID=3038566 RepID=UPI0028656707|nr:hypothetical protein [Caballeronia sp. LZ033]MDR5813058.1 hypothetical protein [Caballeronia sp. LZ033]
MKHAAVVAVLAVTSAAWAEGSIPVVTAKVGQRVTVQVPEQQKVAFECQPADGTLGAVLGVDAVNKINAKIALMNEEAKRK